MSNLEFFKNEAKKFLKDWQTQTTITNSDGSISYHYDWKFYNLYYYFDLFNLNDKDRKEIKLARAQHYISKIAGYKKWDELVSLSPFDLENAENKIRNCRNKSENNSEQTNKLFVPCFRIRCHSEMTLNEKNQFSQALERLIIKIQKSITDIDFWLDYFDRWDLPDDNGITTSYYERREYLKKQINHKKYSFSKIILDLCRKYCFPPVDCYCPVDICQFVRAVGIRVFTVDLKTDKISGFCTSLLDMNTTAQIPEPVIIINRTYCNTVEKYLKEVAKQFYYMIAKPDEFDYKNDNVIKYEMKSTQNEADKFVESLFMPIDILNAWIKRFGEQGQRYSPSLSKKNKLFFLQNYEMQYMVNRIKREFCLDYKTVIKKLLESDWEYKIMFDSYEEAESYYLECLKRHDEKYDKKISWLNGEPKPLPWEYVDYIKPKFCLI